VIRVVLAHKDQWARLALLDQLALLDSLVLRDQLDPRVQLGQLDSPDRKDKMDNLGHKV